MTITGESKSSRNLPAAPFSPGETGLIDAIAIWCECLQGRQPLMAALRQLAGGLGARAVCLARHPRVPGGRPRCLTFDTTADERSDREVTRSFAHCVLGRYVDRPRAASVWFSSLTEEPNDPALAVFQRRARIAETVVIALAIEDKWVDYIELHFASRPGGGIQAVLNTLADTLSRTWIRRSPGLFHDALLASEPRAHPREPLLGTANPARLTRSEFRICVLLSRGLNAASVCSELSISPSTLKTHLRSIFAKTETASLAELLFHLLAPWQGEPGRSGSLSARRRA